jgi:hypothetical protein
LFIQIHTDNQVDATHHDALLEERVRERLGRFEERLTHVEIHVSDVNGPRGGDADLRCTLEARISGLAPVAVAGNGPTVDRAVIGATNKAVRALDHTLGRVADRGRH